jgi:hypothetical protein
MSCGLLIVTVPHCNPIMLYCSVYILQWLTVSAQDYDSKVNVKVKLSLCLNKHHAMKAYWEVEVYLHSFFELGTRWRWVVNFTPRLLYPRGRGPGTHWIGGWVGPRAVLDAVVKRKIPSPRRESNPRTPIVQPVAQRYTDWALTAFLLFKGLSKMK